MPKAKPKMIDTETTIVAKNEAEVTAKFRLVWPDEQESPINEIVTIDVEKDAGGKPTGNTIYRVHSRMEEGTLPAGA